MYMRQHLEASIAITRRMAENQSKPEGIPPA
jgi:hypothetical protein